MHQPFQNRSGGTKQLKLNIVVARPAIKKREHPQAATANRFYFGKIQRNNAGVYLGSHNIAKLENSVASYDPALTLNHRQVVQVFDMYGQHKILHGHGESKNPAKRRWALFFNLMRKFKAGSSAEFREVREQSLPTGNAVWARSAGGE